jgi:hypothetical protein
MIHSAGPLGQYLARKMLALSNIPENHGSKIEIYYIPSHTGMTGNGKADIAAKGVDGKRRNGGRYVR